MEDAQILERIRAKDPEGLALLESRYGSFIHYIVRSVLSGYPEEIEECVNDMWLKFWDILPGYEEDKSSLKTYLARVTRNAALDRQKALLRHSRHFEEGDFSEISQYRPELHTPVDSCEDALLKAEQKARLNEALKCLPTKELDLFLRKYYYLQTAGQIAAETGRSKRSVENRLARIREKLAKALKEVR